LVRDAPGKPIHARFLAKLRSNLGSTYQGAGRRAEAEREYREAIRIADELTTEFPVAPAYRSELAGAMVNLGRLLAADPAAAEEADRLFRGGSAHMARLVADFPADPDYRGNLVVLQSMIGGMRIQQKRFEEAEKAFLDGLATLEGSKPEVRATADHQANLGMIEHNIGEILRARKRPEEALGYYEKAIASQAEALKLNPSSAFSRDSLSNGYWAIAETQIELGRHADAAASASKMLPLFPTRWEERYYAAELLGKCAGLAKDDAGVSQAYADRAMELLREAVDRGYKDAAAIRASDGFEPIRDRPDFRRLVDGLPK
jgi:tetratricopeptide (TPR) repeat protein